MIQTFEVLEDLHQQRPPIIHRDIKPANLIMRHSDQRIIVLDFGAVKEIGTPIGTRIGAEGYSAPEQEEGRPVTQSDLYAIGCTLLFLVTGESPHKFYQQVGTSYHLSAANIPAVPRSLQQVIERVTHPDVQERYQTANELAQALSSYL
jgi:serine/threonine protein kinase, bacterial